LNILQIWLKPKVYVFGGFAHQTLFFVIKTQKALPWPKPRHMSH